MAENKGWSERCRFYQGAREHKVMANGLQRPVTELDYANAAGMIEDLRKSQVSRAATAVQSWRGWRDAW